MFEVKGLNAWYGESHVLHGMEFEVREGEVVTLLGRNGAGKSTTLKSIMGLIAKRQGSILFKGAELIRSSPDKVGRAGIAFCPEERGIFAGLNVHENLVLPPVLSKGGLSVADIHELFPILRERAKSQGTKLSGGEQQMLAIARILRTGAKLLLLDEPTEGLAPVIVQQIGRLIADIKARGFHRAARGAELPLRGGARGPALRRGARPGGGHDPSGRARPSQGFAAGAARHVSVEAH